MTNQNNGVIFLLLAAADRSGEADFLRMLDSCARLRQVEISINKGVRDRNVDALQSDVRWWIRLAEPNVFRISIGDYWGSDYPTVTSDGRTLMLASQITTLDKAPSRIIGISGSFARGGGTYNPLFDFMRGREAASLASPTGGIVKTSSGFRFDSREMGVVDVVLTKRDGLWLPLIIDVSNIAGRMASYRMFPMFSDRPEQPLERFVYDYTFVDRFGKDEFAIKIPKGVPVEDRRKKNPGIQNPAQTR